MTLSSNNIQTAHNILLTKSTFIIGPLDYFATDWCYHCGNWKINVMHSQGSSKEAQGGMME